MIIGNPGNPIPSDTARLDVVKELRKADLLVKEDIKDHNLLSWSSLAQSKMRFEYLAQWDSDCFITGTHGDLPYIHVIIKHSQDLDKFTIYLHTSLKHHPQHMGLLFQTDNNGKTAFERLKNMAKTRHSKLFRSVSRQTLHCQSCIMP